MCTQQPIAGWMYFRLFFSSPFYPPPPSKEKNSGALCIAAIDDDDDDGERLRTVRPSSIGQQQCRDSLVTRVFELCLLFPTGV